MLEIKNLSKVYIPKNGVPVLALDDISLNIEDKGMVFILGKSGSGKSTFLNLIGGLDKYDQGDIKIYGKSTKDFTQANFDSYRNTFVGFVFQEYNILEEFTVGQNIALAIQLQGKKPTDEMLNEILEEVDLEGYGNRKPNELSGGQLQRVAIARALVKNPEVIMADEPTGALDSKTGIQIFDTLKKISKDKLVIVVSHDREFAEQYADRIVEFADGKIISDVKRFAVAKEGLDSAISVEGNKVTVKKGYKLTANDFTVINHYIEKNADDMQNGKIDNQQSVFKEIDSKIVLTSKPDKEFKKTKSSLPFKNSIRIGASSLRNKKFRLIITILLSTIAFGLFGVVATFANYKNYSVMANTIIENQIDYLDIQHSGSYSQKNIQNNDIEYFEQLSPNSKFLKVYSGTANSFRIGGYDSSLLGSIYFSMQFPGVVEADMTKEELQLNYGFTMEGELPKADNEIAITKYLYEYFKTGGCGYSIQYDYSFGYDYNYEYDFESEFESTPFRIDSVDDLIGENINIKINAKILSVKVTGVIDTKLDDTELAIYKDAEESAKMIDQWNNKTFRLFNCEVRNSFHSLAFVNKGFIEHYGVEEIYTINKDNIELDYVDSIKEKDELTYINKNSEILIDKMKISALLSNKCTNVFFDINKTQLETDEILLPYKLLCSDFATNVGNAVKEYCNNIDNVPQTIKDLSQDELNNYFTYYNYQCKNAIPTDSDYSNAYFQWMQYSNINNTEYGDKVAIIKQINDEEIARAISGKTATDYDVSLNLKKSNISTIKNVKVVGCYLKENNMDDYSDTFVCYESNYNMVITEELMNELELETCGAYSRIIGKVPTELKELNNLTESIYTYTEGEEEEYTIINSASGDIEFADYFVAPKIEIFLYVAIGLAVFAMLFIMNYISTSITYKKRDIGILRAMGARGIDVFGIFFNESIIIAAINFVLSVVATFVAIFSVNFVVKNDMTLDIILFKVGILQVLLIGAVCFIASAISSFLPVYNISKKQPVEAIKNTLST
ncbi:MAG: ATP-binding cassette domain-containing protein [Clostridia bacterium]|nr:ATP-binding cassette domain-containing protein [Clostridia bacterium]